MNGYVLAMYDVRGKQEFIYKTNKIKEIIGGSWLIRDCFDDYLFKAAKKVKSKGMVTYKEGCKNADYESEDFSRERFEEHLKAGYVGEVVYEGGGNFFVLYDCIDSYREVNRIFYKMLFEEIGTLKVLSSYIEGVDFEDYGADQKRIYEVHRENERKESVIYPVNALPIVQVDYRSSMPLVKSVNLPATDEKGRDILRPEKVTLESYAKYVKYNSCAVEQKYDTKILDDMIEGKGIDSHLAVIYIDGNGMGAKVESCLCGMKTYEECVKKLREFSGDIEKDYIVKPRKVIDEYFESESELGRFVVYAGDEVTFICKARHAFNLVKTYFEALPDAGQGDNTSCAGIAIFKSHAPYSEAYRIAEECCETGKQIMKKRGILNACMMDFEYLQGAIGVSLEHIREHGQTEAFCKPWLFSDKLAGSEKTADEVETIDDVTQLRGLLNIIARTNSKTLLAKAKEFPEAYEQEIERIVAHFKGSDADKQFLVANKEKLKKSRVLVYRMMLVYDLWFKETAAKEEDAEK